MGKSKHRKRFPIPKIDMFYSLDCEKQIALYQNAKKHLSPAKRDKLNKGPILPPKLSELKSFLAAIEFRWESLREDCKNNSDFFKWPSTQAWSGNGRLHTKQWEKLGALKLFDYSVGQDSGLTADDRKFLLDCIFEAVIPPFTSWQKVAEWGDPHSALRLQKMAKTIAALTRNAKRNQASDLAGAINRWEDDLDYLYEKFYIEKFYFDWPTPFLLNGLI